MAGQDGFAPQLTARQIRKDRERVHACTDFATLRGTILGSIKGRAPRGTISSQEAGRMRNNATTIHFKKGEIAEINSCTDALCPVFGR